MRKLALLGAVVLVALSITGAGCKKDKKDRCATGAAKFEEGIKRGLDKMSKTQKDALGQMDARIKATGAKFKEWCMALQGDDLKCYDKLLVSDSVPEGCGHLKDQLMDLGKDALLADPSEPPATPTGDAPEAPPGEAPAAPPGEAPAAPTTP